MSSFTHALVIQDTGDGKYWIIPEGHGFIFWTMQEHLGPYVKCPEGTRTDLGSIPRIVQWLIPKLGKYNGAMVVHDRVYLDGFVLLERGNAIEQIQIDRAEADRILMKAMRCAKVNGFYRNLIYSGVVAGGWVAWNRHRKHDTQDSK